MRKKIFALAVAAMAVLGAKAQKTINGHEWVDLGLSVMWATTNVGADNVQGYGNYYAWGETETKTTYTWNNYKWKSGTTEDVELNLNYSSPLSAENDAATVNWGEGWRMPTPKEIIELFQKCYWVWTSNDNSTNVKGYIVYKTKNDADKGLIKNSQSFPTPVGEYSLSDTHIFLPAAGRKVNSAGDNIGSYGYYRTNQIYSYGFGIGYAPQYIHFASNKVECAATVEADSYTIQNRAGCPVRAVVEKTKTISDIPEGWTVNGESPVDGKVKAAPTTPVTVAIPTSSIPVGKKVKSIKAVPVE